ncbi:MAG: UPF0175 family protein [Anaerolineae bacterium]|nr:UPF0175 family protein [Anaerolineae bacterium]
MLRTQQAKEVDSQRVHLERRTMILELPFDLRDALRVPVAEQENRLRCELAIRLYEKGLLSFGKARGLAGLSKWAFHELLANEGVLRHYDLDELEADLDTLEALA